MLAIRPRFMVLLLPGGRTHLTEDDARCLYLVRAIEREDRHGDLLTAEDRNQSDATARPHADRPDAFLAHRARFAAARLATRNPAVERALRISRWPGWTGWAVPLAGFVLGALANELDNGRRLDLLAAPLLGTLAWNLLVYAGLLPGLLRRRGRHAALPFAARFAGWRHARPDAGTPMARALARFAADWGMASVPLTSARAARTLHLGAALFALGLVAGIYLRALAVEYRAGWESTLLGPAQVHALLAALLGPASAVTGIALPDTAGVAALRWTGPDSGGENAARWIHLFTATTLGLVTAPRLLLAGWHAARAARLARHFPVPGREDFYIRRLLRGADGAQASVRATPYAFRPEEGLRSRLEDLLRQALGDGARIHFDEPVDYGSEDSWLAAASLRPDDDHHVLLFSLSATPEDENHGAFAKGLHAALPAGTTITAVIDESAFRARFAGQAGSEPRIQARRRGWAAVLAGAGLVPLTLDLAQETAQDAQRLEAVLSDARMVHGA